MTAYIQDGGSAVNPPHADDAPRSRAEFTYPATEVIRERLRHVLAAHPHLTNNGIGLYGHPNPAASDPALVEDRLAMLDDDACRQFARAEAYLSRHARTVNINSRVGTSYGLKHRAETWFGAHFEGEPYISNGMFIAAAIDLGFEVKRADRNSPNVHLNISERRDTLKVA